MMVDRRCKREAQVLGILTVARVHSLRHVWWRCEVARVMQHVSPASTIGIYGMAVPRSRIYAGNVAESSKHGVQPLCFY